MEVFDPNPLLGGCRWIASPAQNTRPDCRWVAYISLLPHREVPVISTWRSGIPRRLRTICVAAASSTTGGSSLMSYPQTMSHSFQGRTMRTRPAPMPPTFDPGWMTQ
jgi:hypothetical protein